MPVARSVTEHDSKANQKVVLLECARNLCFRLDPHQIWYFPSHKVGVTIYCIFQLGLLVYLCVVGWGSHESPSAKLLLEGAVSQRIKVHGEDRVHKTIWIVNSEFLSFRRPRNNVLFSFLFSVGEQRMKATKKLSVLFHPIRDCLSIDTHLFTDGALPLHQEAMEVGSLLDVRIEANESPAIQNIDKTIPFLRSIFKVSGKDFINESLLIVNVERDAIGLPRNNIRFDILAELGIVQRIVKLPRE